MNLLFKNAIIIDKHSQYNNKAVDIKVEAGIIKQIGNNITAVPHFEVIELENLHISRGWFDSSVSFGEPGYEDRETLANGLNTAAISGFTNVAVQPNGNPITDTQADIHFLLGKASNTATSVHPIGALTKGSNGSDIAELFDMKNAGAVAFGDYNKAIPDANIAKIALQYVQDFDGLVIAYAQDDKIKGKGVVHEGAVSTRLGLKGIPALAEELQIARNLFLLEYTGGKMHIPTISTAKSVQLVKEAKAKGLNVTCSVAVHHLLLTDEVLIDFDTRYKVAPPLRPKADIKELIAGVLDGTIDLITSDHNPIDIENKKMEFDLAKDGTIGLESAFGALLTVLPLEMVIEKLTTGKQLFAVQDHVIGEGKPASFTLFNPEAKYTFTKQDILSKSKNSAFLGIELQGKAYGIYNNGKLILKNN
ncbi:dihydroorotase [Flavobacterium arcticum]|uniref:Dihydroorotase n=1 Tax=Flavobacterium arcticum TaxID=1784713 RepID=A0A345HDF2_9FLAO|nr:dihydroorotase [Flavobacterium arcticum]AXG74612.1 dihydroorotase [Flavobacterium arcticum]KAF2512266.1 dihydroorotase [Flavobacterium arcticum]